MIALSFLFIFVSSIAVNGADTNDRQPFLEEDIPNPVTYYGQSKLMAEDGIKAVKALLKIVPIQVRCAILLDSLLLELETASPNTKHVIGTVLSNWVSENITQVKSENVH